MLCSRLFLSMYQTKPINGTRKACHCEVRLADHLSLSCGVRALGCRLDSGDLSYLSQEVRKMTTEASKTFNRPFLATTNIVASNDINEESLHSLADQVGCW